MNARNSRANSKTRRRKGDSFKSIDFHQLQIKNSQYLQKIEERNAELLRLKTTTGKTVQVLNTSKHELNELLGESKRLEKEIADKVKSQDKLTAELGVVEVELEREQQRNSKFRIRQANPDMPQVLDYVKQKSQAYDLQAAVHNWRRKNEIVEMAWKRTRRSQTMSARSGSSSRHQDQTLPQLQQSRSQTDLLRQLPAPTVGDSAGAGDSQRSRKLEHKRDIPASVAVKESLHAKANQSAKANGLPTQGSASHAAGNGQPHGASNGGMQGSDAGKLPRLSSR